MQPQAAAHVLTRMLLQRGPEVVNRPQVLVRLVQAEAEHLPEGAVASLVAAIESRVAFDLLAAQLAGQPLSAHQLTLWGDELRVRASISAQEAAFAISAWGTAFAQWLARARPSTEQGFPDPAQEDATNHHTSQPKRARWRAQLGRSMSRSKLLYHVFVGYAFVFVVFFGGMMGFFFGFMFGASLSYATGLNMFSTIFTIAPVLGVVGMVIGLRAFWADIQAKSARDLRFLRR